MCVFAGQPAARRRARLYAKLIRAVRKLGVLTVVDTDGEPLRLAVRAEPDVVSPNELEAEELVGPRVRRRSTTARDAVVEITRSGPREAIMTVADGCYAYVREDGGQRSTASRSSRSRRDPPIGSGDAFLAGYVAARYQGRSPVECLRFGVACGAESTQHVGAGILDPGTRRAAARRASRLSRSTLPAEVS